MTIRGALAARGQVGSILATQRGGAAVADWWLGPWPGFPAASAIGAANCVAAYRAINTPGSPWGAGPGSLAESYVNLANPGTYDAAPGVAPTWAGATGWTFDGLTQYLKTGYIATPLQGIRTVLIQYSGLTAIANQFLFGAEAAASTFYIYYNFGGWMRAYTYFYSSALNAPILNTGNYALAGLQPYRNGVAEPNAIGAAADRISDKEIYVGAHNANGVAAGFSLVTIKAFCIYKPTLDVNQMAALATVGTGAMAAL